jgi:hypothetical protein
MLAGNARCITRPRSAGWPSTSNHRRVAEGGDAVDREPVITMEAGSPHEAHAAGQQLLAPSQSRCEEHEHPLAGKRIWVSMSMVVLRAGIETDG